MSLGIRLHDAAGTTLHERAVSARAQGFECVHLALSKTISADYMNPDYATPGLASYVKKELGGLDIAVLGCYLNLTHPDPIVYQATLMKYIAHLQLARWMGAGVVGTETGNPNAEYRYDPACSHSPDALKLLIDRLAPVVEAAEKLGATLALEPVYTHIMYNPECARRVLDAFKSPCLKIILDPVNLLNIENIDRRDALMDEAFELLGEDIAVIHLKDYVIQNGSVQSLAVGTGVMDYRALARFAAMRKPHIDMTFEDTTPSNAEAARLHMQALLERA